MPTRTSKRPRRKAKQQRSRETVEAVLDAAARVLLREGYARATTNRIAERAGVSVGSVYEYFASKEAIYDALIQRDIEALVGAIRSEGLDPDASIHDTVGQFLRLAMGAMRHGPDLVRSLEQVPGAVFRRRLAAARRSVIGFVRQFLEAHREELRVSDLGLAAFIVVSAAEGVGSNASGDRFDDRLAEELASLLNLYLTGGEACR